MRKPPDPIAVSAATPSGCAAQAACAAGMGIDRRTMLRVGAAGSVAVVSLPLACGDTPSLSSGPIVAGKVSAVPVGSLRHITGEPGFIGRDTDGLYAMSARCTHQGCTVSEPSGTQAIRITCPCHGSQFDLNGALLKGPATSPLQHYRVDLAADGTITVQGAVPVGSNQRTPVPA